MFRLLSTYAITMRSLFLFLQGLEKAFKDDKRDIFEQILYQRIKDVAIAVCTPKVATTEEATASLSQTTSETSEEAELVLYKQLLGTIFAQFEQFLANSDCGNNPASSSTDASTPIAILKNKLDAVCPKTRTPCGRIFKALEPTFRCK